MGRKPRWMRWRESGTEVVLAPHWGHFGAAGFVLALNIGAFTIFGLKAANAPDDGKHAPWYFWVYVGLVFLALLAWFTYPFWGRVRLSFEDGIFRAGKHVSLTLAELESFSTESTSSGVDVFVQKRDGTLVPLSLPLGSPLTAPNGKNPTMLAKLRDHGRDEADFAVERLTALLAQARSAHPTSYRA